MNFKIQNNSRINLQESISKMKKNTISFFTLFIICQIANAQMTVTNAAPYNSANNLVDDVLLGNGVTASNVTFSGNANQIGYFDGTNSNIGLASGIVMSTGNVNNIPNASPDTDFGGPGDAQILSVAQLNNSAISSTNDAAVLEFDFAVTGDTVKFEFVFASDEYPTYINSIYNDAFAFFLSGPGITGPYPSPANFPGGAVNVALVPGTTDPISISTIYDDPFQTPTQVNGQYYIENNGTSHGFNGFTTVIQIAYPVICGETYHFKFAIADCEDGSLDTGVFLGARSLGSEGISVSSFAPFPDNTLGENCGQGGFVFSHSDTTVQDVLNLNISGNAIMGTDYNNIPTTITLPIGVTSDTIFIDAYQDNIAEGLDTIKVDIVGIEGCSIASILIQSIEEMTGTLGVDSTNICYPETTELTANVTGGLPPYNYYWTESIVNNDTIVVSPEITTFYNVNVEDQCGNQLLIEESEVWVQCPLMDVNVFTPNGDGDNDFFTLINLDDYPSAKISIYNRWGKLVYEADNYQNDWDGTHYKNGKDVDSGTYYYVVTPKSDKYLYDDNKDPELEKTYTGYFQIMR